MQSVEGIRPPRFLDHSDEGGEVGVEEDDHYEELCNHPWPGTEGPVVLVVALACGIFAKLALKQTKVPYTVLLTVLGGFLGLLHDIVYEVQAKQVYKDTSLGSSTEAWLNINPHILIVVFLPVLIFESALNTEWHIFKRLGSQILTLAIPGVVLSTILIAMTFKYILFPNQGRWDWNAALTMGAILSATDPVAVVALMKELGVSERLATLIEGESLLNDSTAIVVFQVFWSQLQHDLSVCDIERIGGPGEVVGSFFRLSLGGIALGLLMGWLLQYCLSRCFNDFQTEVTLTLLTAFGTMLLAEGTPLNFSGILSLVTVGLTMSAKGKFFLSSEATHAMHHVWGTLGHLANTVIFFLAGLIIAGPDVLGSREFNESFGERFSKLLLLFVLLQIIRAIMIASLWPLLSRGHYEFNWRHASAITFGGLRGAVGLTLGLIVHETLIWHVEAPARQLGNEILFYTSGVAVLMLVINGTSMEVVLNWLEISGSSKSTQRAYENVSLKLAEEVTGLFDELKENETKNSSGLDWAAALSYVPSRSKAAYQCLNLAIREELELSATSNDLETSFTQDGNIQVNNSGSEASPSNYVVNPMSAHTTSQRNPPAGRAEQSLLSLQSMTSKVLSPFEDTKHQSAIVNELLQRLPTQLRSRILRKEKKWPSVLSAETGFQTAAMMTQSESTMLEQKADMVELRRRFVIALKGCYSCLHHDGHCDAASVAILVDGANRQIDDTDHDAESQAVEVGGPSMVLAHGSEVQVVVSNTSTFTHETAGSNASADSNDVNGKELDSWKHLLDAIGGGVPSFLSSSIFAALLNTPVLRTGLKEYVAQQLGAVFDVVDGFVVGHERTLVHFLEEHARDLAAAAAVQLSHCSQSTATSTNEAQARRQQRPTFRRNISAMNAMVSTRGKIHVGALAVEVRTQLQLAQNWLDSLLQRFPEVAFSMRTKKAARLLLSGERHIVERLGHEGTIEESEVQSLLEANFTSVKKLASHPASLAVPSKIQRIRRHPLFKNISEGAAAALAKHCTEKYFEPNACLLKQYAPAKHWLLPIQGTYKVFQSAASLSSKYSAVGNDDDLDSDSGSSESQFRASVAAATSAADIAALRETVSSDAVDVTNTTFHGIDIYQKKVNSDGMRKIADGGALNAPLGLEDALGAAGYLIGGGKCDGYRYSVHSPGYTHVLMVNGNATAELVNEHPSLHDAIWRFMAASTLLRNPQWMKDATRASVAMAAANAAPGAVVLPAGVSARDLALSIVRPHQSRGGRAKAGYVAVLSKKSGTSAPKLGPKAAAVLLLDGTLTLSRSLATLLNLDSSGAQTAAADGGGANDDRTGATLVSCAAAVTCGGPGEPSTLDGTANVSRLVPYAAADSNGLQQIQFAARSVFFVLNQQDFVNASFLPSSHLSSTTSKPSKAPAAEPSSQSEALNVAVPSVPDNGSATRMQPVSIGSYIDGVPPTPLSGDTEAPAVPDTSFASQGESGGLPDGWTAHVDPASKKTYYLSAASGETTWEKPSALPAPPTEI